MRVPRGNVRYVPRRVLPALFVVASGAAPESRLSGSQTTSGAKECLVRLAEIVHCLNRKACRALNCTGCILASNVTFSGPTTEELLKRTDDLIHQDREYLADFSAAIDQLQKRKEEFQAEHPPFGSRYS